MISLWKTLGSEAATRVRTPAKPYLVLVLATLVLLLLPLLLILVLALMFTAYRYIVLLVLRRRYREPLTLLGGMDTVCAQESDQHVPVIVTVVQIEGHLDLEVIRKQVRERMLEAREEDGQYMYPRLRHYAHNEYGYYVWRREDPCCVENHVVQREEDTVENEEELKQLLGKLSTEHFPKGLSGWMIHLVRMSPSYPWKRKGPGNERWTAVFRIHHALGDGVGLVGMVLQSVLDKQPVKATFLPPSRGQRLSNFANFLGICRTTLFAPYAIFRQLALRDGDHALHGRKLTGKKIVGLSNPIDLNIVKSIKNATGSTVNDVLVSCLNAAFKKHYDAVKEEVPQRLTAIMPISLHPVKANGSVEMANRCSYVHYLIPLHCNGDSLDRLKQTREFLIDIKNSPTLITNYYGLGWLMNRIPTYFTKPVFNTARITCVVSNVPGPQQPMTMWEGHNLERVGFLIPHRGYIGVTVSMMSFNGFIQVGITIDSALVEGPQEVDRLMENFEKELEVLQNLIQRKSQ